MVQAVDGETVMPDDASAVSNWRQMANGRLCEMTMQR